MLADKIIFIDNGKIIFDKYRDELLDNNGILKCDLDNFENIQKEDIIRYKKNKYNYEILVENKSKMMKKYKDYIVDEITIDELMILIIKGEEI